MLLIPLEILTVMHLTLDKKRFNQGFSLEARKTQVKKVRHSLKTLLFWS